jgi:hypothetical protein
MSSRNLWDELDNLGELPYSNIQLTRLACSHAGIDMSGDFRAELGGQEEGD